MNQPGKPWMPARGLLLFAYGLLILAPVTSFARQVPTADHGVLDLRQWKWDERPPLDLNGMWQFYWNQLYSPATPDSPVIRPTYIPVPDYWNSYIPRQSFPGAGFGYATYRLLILCPASTQNWALKFLTISSAYRVFVNGREQLNIGKVGTMRQDTKADFYPVVLPVQSEDGRIDLVIQVANYTFDEGGIWDVIRFGPRAAVRDEYTRDVAWDFFISGSFFLMGIFYLVLFLFFRRRLSPVYFSLFCLLLAVRPLVTDEIAIRYFVNWDWKIIKHIEFTSFYLTVPILSLFTYYLLPDEFSKRILRVILVLCAPFVVAGIFATPFIFRYPVRIFQCMMFLAAFYGLYLYIRAVKSKRPGAAYLLVGFLVLFVAIVNDLLNARLIIETPHLIYAGLVLFTVSQAITLSKQFFWTYARLEIANARFAQINGELNLKNATIVETNDQLQKLNTELDSLVFRTSHDLRSPITSVLTLAEIIRDEEDTQKRSEYLNAQKKILFRLNALIEGTLDFAKNKRLELKYEPVDFNEFIRDALRDHLFAENAREVQRIVEVRQTTTFYTDRTRLSIVVNNLISNALRYHDPGKDPPYLKIGVQADAQHAVINVEDNGLGMDPTYLEHIFALFYRGSEGARGSGIGLYIVKNAVEKLHGTIAVESKVGEGTRFTIDIPNRAAG